MFSGNVNTMRDMIELISTADWEAAWAVLRALRPDLDKQSFMQMRDDLLRDGYKLFGSFTSDQLACVAGVTIRPHVTRGRVLWIHDLVTVPVEEETWGVIKALYEAKNNN